MIGRLISVVLDCPDPAALAAFYAEVLGGEVEAEDETWIDLKRTDGDDLSFQLSTDFRAPAWPDPERPQQFHLDVRVPRAEMDEAERKVLALGATLLEGDLGGSRNWRVYADPAGHPFCLCAAG
jgi:catechol 2,3-dioxygenase-like lactoylglutathione lyase family enzyme